MRGFEYEKQIYFRLVVLTALLLAGHFSEAQICVPFAQRTSHYSPSKTVYHVRGDFAMIGNTSLTLQNYGDLTQNGNNVMVYTDVDAPELTGLGGTPTFNSSSATLTFSDENGAVSSCSNIVYAGLYWTGRAHNAASANIFSVTKYGVTKNFDKRKIQLKGPASSEYTEFTASASDIYYPVTTHDYMYSAYTEVTDYVKANGIGAYFAADIALSEGNGGGTGYYGGWGMVVVYENSQMKPRDITLFDGHAYVVAGNANFDIPVSSFNTVQAGPVGVKMGFISGEGDNGITGDYFQIQKNSDGTYVNLTHIGNTQNNFFNSSIQTGGNARAPNLINNSGLDIGMFEIPNPSNSVIGNNQTSTNFRYGSMGDTYIIFAMVLAVDAYIPDIEGVIAALSINNEPPGPTPPEIAPGEEMELKVKLYNKGLEAIENAVLTIPVPYNATYVENSAMQNLYFSPEPTPNEISFNPSLGMNGTLVWNIGTLPVPNDPNEVLGEIVFKLTATENCTLLKNTGCNNVIAIGGYLAGEGEATGIEFTNTPLIQGFVESGTCAGIAIPAPLRVSIDAANFITEYCPGIPSVTSFVFCDSTEFIPVSEISSGFEPGTFFYNQYPPIGGSAIQFTTNNPFPATPGTSTYYAVSPGNTGCYFEFTITVGSITSMPVTSDVVYCVGDTPVPLNATPTNQLFTLYYYASPDAPPQTVLIPPTDVPGQSTYFVAEAQSPSCIGPKKPILVTVNPAPVATAPEAMTINGCDLSLIEGLAYSTTSVSITTEQFIDAGGTLDPIDVEYQISYSDTSTGTCPITITRSFEIANNCGVTTVLQQITVGDTTPPVFEPLENVTVGCDEQFSFAQAVAVDGCGDVTLAFEDTITPGECEGSYTAIRNWIATDACGNMAEANQIITIVDQSAPVLSASAQDIHINCLDQQSEIDQWLDSNGYASVIDGCSTFTWTHDYAHPAPGTSGTIEVSFTATDGCGNAVTTTASIHITTGSIVPEFDGLSPICNGTTAPTLPAESSNGITGTWTPSVISTTSSGSYTFLPDAGQCAEPHTMEIVVTNAAVPTFSSLPASICEGAEFIFPTASDEGIVGIWTPAAINALETTTYIFTPSANQCAAETTATIEVTPNTPINASAYAQCNSDIGLIINLDATLPENVPVGGTWTDIENSGGLNGSNFFPSGLPVGIYSLRYQVAGEQCLITVDLTLEVDDDCGVADCGNIIVHNAFTPNNDGLNDVFVIENIDDFGCYPINKIEIYNRWQVLVYETAQYDNRQHCFKGISEGRVTVDKYSELPTGTYFYLLQYTTSDGKVLNKEGYLYLSR